MLPVILKFLTPQIIKALPKIMEYVFEKNDLDFKVENHNERLLALEKTSHAPKDWQKEINLLKSQIKELKDV